MATKKAPAKITKKPVSKSAPVKGKTAAPPSKKAAPVKKAVVNKPAPKVVAKKVVAKAAPKKIAKPLAKVAVKAVAKNVVKKAAKPVSKVQAKSVNKVVAKPQSRKAVAPQKPEKQLLKKIETKKVVAKAEPAKKTAVKAPEKVVAAPKVAEKAIPKVAPAKPTVQKPVVLPKINTKTSRKYEPDFTKSVLDKAPADPGAPIVMYSDGDLSEFKELIQRKLGSAKKELAYLQGLITRKDDMGGDEGDGRYMTMEDGSLSMEREQLSQMASRQITFVDHLEKALIRIENKTYGVCRITGKLIDKARLRAVPHATLSIEAKMGGGK